MNYESEVLALLRVGHTVEMAKEHENARPTWHMDGVPLGTDLTAGDHVQPVTGAEYNSVWRRRKLTGDPKKDAAMLLGRHEAALAAKAAREAKNARLANAYARQAAIHKALAVKGAGVAVNGDVVVTFQFASLTPEQAAKLGAAVRAVCDTALAEVPFEEALRTKRGPS